MFYECLGEMSVDGSDAFEASFVNSTDERSRVLALLSGSNRRSTQRRDKSLKVI